MRADPDLPPYAPARILAAPFPERVRLACRTRAARPALRRPGMERRAALQGRTGKLSARKTRRAGAAP